MLRKELDAEAQDRGGALLYASLIDTFRVVVLGTEDRVKDEHFLTVNGFLRYTLLDPLRPEDGITEHERKFAQANRLRRDGFNFEFVVTPDPDVATFLFRTGIPSLLYLHPTFSAESFRPDYQGGIRPWSALVDEVEYQRTVRAEQAKKESVDQ